MCPPVLRQSRPLQTLLQGDQPALRLVLLQLPAPMSPPPAIQMFLGPQCLGYIYLRSSLQMLLWICTQAYTSEPAYVAAALLKYMSWLDPLLPAIRFARAEDVGRDLREHPPAHVTPTQQNKLAASKRAEAAAKAKSVANNPKAKAGLIPFPHLTNLSALLRQYFLKKNSRPGQHGKIVMWAVLRKLEACTSLLLQGLA